MRDAGILLILIPLAASGFYLLEKTLPRQVPRTLSRLLAIGVPIAGMALLAAALPAVLRGETIEYAVGGWGLPVGISLRMDGLAWLGSLLIMIIAFASLLYAWNDPGADAVFRFFFMVSVAGMQGVVLTDDLFNMFVFLEIIGLSVYVLIAFGRKQEALVAGFRYLILGSLGMAFFLLGLFIVYRHTGSFSLQILSGFRLRNQEIPQQIRLAGILLLTGIGVRTAFVPFHTWLPDAHGFAPHPVSALLSGVMIKVSFIALWRILEAFDDPFLIRLVLWLGAVTAIFGVFRALIQTDAKKLLAYHSISQMGYILAGFGAAGALARAASLYHAAGHALFKSLLFLSVGAVIDATGERNIYRLGNIGRKLPLVTITFVIAALAISGIPPMNGFVSKKLLLKGVSGDFLPYLLIRITGIGTMASFIKLSWIFLPLSGEPAPDVRNSGRPTAMRYGSLLMLAGLCIVTGLAPGFWLSGFSRFAGGGDIGAVAPLYGFAVLADAVGVFAAGLLLALLVRSSAGRRISHGLDALRVGLNGSLELMVGGVLVLVLAARFL